MINLSMSTRKIQVISRPETIRFCFTVSVSFHFCVLLTACTETGLHGMADRRSIRPRNVLWLAGKKHGKSVRSEKSQKNINTF